MRLRIMAICTILIFSLTIFTLICYKPETNASSRNNRAFGTAPIPESHLPSFARITGGFAFINQDGFLVVATPQEEFTINTPGRVCSFSWSPYGDKIALITSENYSGNKCMSIYDLPTRQLEKVPQYSGRLLTGVSWAPRGYYIRLDYNSTSGNSSFFQVVTAGAWETVCQKDFDGRACWSPDGMSILYASPITVDPETPSKSYNLVRRDLPTGTDTIIAKGTSGEIYSPCAWTSDNTVIYSKLSFTDSFAPELWKIKDGGQLPSKISVLPFPLNKNSIVSELPGNVIDTDSTYYSWSPNQKYFGIWRNNNGTYELGILNWDTKVLTFLGRGTDLAWRHEEAKHGGLIPWASKLIGDI